MKAKTVFIVILTALVTIILMKNADEVEFWIFGTHMVPKLAVLGTMFVVGVIVGLMIGRGKKKHSVTGELPVTEWEIEEETVQTPPKPLNKEDSDYIN